MRAAAFPFVGDLLAVMPKERGIEGKPTIVFEVDDLAHLRQTSRSAIGGEPHHFVFVAVIGEAEELRQRLVEDPKRVGEKDPFFEGDRAAAADPPGGTRKVPKAVDGGHRRFAKRRDKKARSEMSEMVLNAVNFGLD